MKAKIPALEMKKQKEVKLGKNPTISELIAWAEQNGMMVQFFFRDREEKKTATPPKPKKKEIK